MRDYGTLHTSFWTSDGVRGMSGDAKLLAIYLLTSPHSNLIGCFRLPDGYVCEDLGWPVETVAERFGELFQKGFATREERSKYVLVHGFLRWNKIENPNQGKAAAKLFEQVPDACEIKPLLVKALREHAPRFPAEILAEFERVAERLPQPFRNQEQEQQQDQDQEPEQKHDAEDVRAPTSMLPAVIVQSDSPDAADDWPSVRVMESLVETVGSPRLDPAKSPQLVQTSGQLAGWKRAGASWEFDVVPVVMALCAKSKTQVHSWAYFRDAVLQSIADNRQALNLPEASPQRPAYQRAGSFSAIDYASQLLSDEENFV